mmetsp:Transcript_17159/g.56033  ORF Transcript_17159/g.56033 Transcript_17159/m.56033 type:complete len:244 (+) Transcript_17159:789-1520(+)
MCSWCCKASTSTARSSAPLSTTRAPSPKSSSAPDSQRWWTGRLACATTQRRCARRNGRPRRAARGCGRTTHPRRLRRRRLRVWLRSSRATRSSCRMRVERSPATPSPPSGALAWARSPSPTPPRRRRRCARCSSAKRSRCCPSTAGPSSRRAGAARRRSAPLPPSCLTRTTGMPPKRWSPRASPPSPASARLTSGLVSTTPCSTPRPTPSQTSAGSTLRRFRSGGRRRQTSLSRPPRNGPRAS